MENKLKEILTDEQFKILSEKNLIREKSIRNFHILIKFKKLFPAVHSKRYGAYKQLANENKGLHTESIKKILYDLGVVE